MLIRIVRNYLAPTRGSSPGSWCSSSSAPSPRCTCPASTPRSSTRVSPRATPATSSGPAAGCSRVARADRRHRRRDLPRRRGSAVGLGRDLRARIFARVGDFSAQEVSRFGAPTLISRNTNDVTQVQTVVFMGLAIMVSAPIMMVGGIIMALREDVGLSWLVAVAVPAARPLGRPGDPQDDPAVPAHAGVGRLGEPVMREQITGIRVVRAFVREDLERARFAEANTPVHRHGARASAG